MAEKRSVTIIVSIIGAVATIAAALISAYVPRKNAESRTVPANYENEQRLRADLLAEVRRALKESSGKTASTKSGMTPFDESYVAALVDAVRKIAEEKEGVQIESKSVIKQNKVVNDLIETHKVTNFGDTIRLSSKTTVKDFMLIEDVIRIDVFPYPRSSPAESFTIMVRNFMVDTISNEFSVKLLDVALKGAGFDIRDTKSNRDGSLEVSCQYKNPTIEGGRIFVSTGIGVPTTSGDGKTNSQLRSGLAN